jgi:tyrosinase
MSRQSRRRFLTGTAMLPLGVWLERTVLAQYGKPGTAPRVRAEVSTSVGQANLAKYEKAVGIMKATAKQTAGNPQGWTFQWYTHWTPSDKNTLINQVYPGCAPANWCNLAKATWATCMAHFQPQSEEPYFLPWHRMYVFFLEAIAQNVLKDTTFALPYWDYTKNAVLPAPFRNPSSPLFDGNRGTGINGKPVNDGDPIDTTASLTQLQNQALCQAKYPIQSPTVDGFCATLDWYLHGTVHGDIGGDMGRVPTAGNDPIFWMHHCNIDRLWASWNQNGGANPGDSGYLGKTFTFADGSGNSTSPAVKMFVATAPLGYAYDYLTPKPSNCPTEADATRLTDAANTGVTDRAAGPVTLGPQPVRVALQPAPAAKGQNAAERFKAVPAAARVTVLLKGIRADVHPGVVYDVYLNAAPTASRSDIEPRRIGAISFFDIAGHGAHTADRVYRFDATDVVRRLSGAGAFSEGLSVTFVPRGQPAADAKPVIAEVSVIRH